MRTEKEIRDKLDLELMVYKKAKKEFNKEPLDSKYLLDMHEDLLEIEMAISVLKWVLGE